MTTEPVAQLGTAPLRVAITGSSGLVGGALRRFLGSHGHSVTRVLRRAPGGSLPPNAILWDPRQGRIDGAGLEGHDVVVHLAGANLLGVWTPGRKRRIRDSRVRSTELLAATLAGLQRPPRLLVTASGMNYYGVHPWGQPLAEESPPGTGFLAEVVRAWEEATAAAAETGIRVAHLRSANVLSPRGGMLAVMLPVFRLGLGGRLGSGDQAWSWVALEEIPLILMHLLARSELSGPVNVAAPGVVTNREFTRILARVLHRPAILAVPEIVLRLAPGGMGDEVLLTSQQVVPRKLLDSGYQFQWPELEPALRDMVE